MPQPFRVGFLGAGLIATYHSKSLRRSGVEAELGVVRAGVFDPDRERAESFAAASGHTVCASEDEVLDGCDAVYICTWTSEHPRQVAKAVERGRHVFCEKPLATSVEAAEQMATLASGAGITNQVGLVLRRSPAYVWARHLVTEQAAGRVMGVVFRDDQFIPVQGHYASTWRGRAEHAGRGTLLEHSIHDIDMLRFVVGDIRAVSAHEANFHGIDRIEDVVSATLHFADGALGTLLTVWHDNLARPSLRRAEVFCERRYVAIEGDDWFGPVHWTDAEGSSHSLEGDDLVGAVAPLIDGDVNPDAAFVRAAIAGRRSWPDLDTAVASHRIVDAIYQSAGDGGAARQIGAHVVQLTSTETHALRRAVLRAGMPGASVVYPEDDWPDTVHLGIRDPADGASIATSTWVRKDLDGRPAPAVQLRGMAIAAALQGRGIGGQLFEAGVARARAAGVATVWARARDSALDFYAQHGCDVVGDGFVDETTGLPHHVVVRPLG